jgi:hypothetical protein
MTGERKMDLEGMTWLQMGDSNGKKPGTTPGIVGPSLKSDDETLMMRTFACGHYCPVNKYDEDGNPDKSTIVDGQNPFWYGYKQMTITQMRDHLVDYHLPKGHYIDASLLKKIERRAAQIEDAFNQARRLAEAEEAEELKKAQKAFAKIRASA